MQPFLLPEEHKSKAQMSSICVLKQLYDVTMKVELAQQEIDIINLEKIEYKKEINQLKQQNELLLKENNLYSENAKREQQHVLLLRSISKDFDELNLTNSMLNKQTFKYEKLITNLKLKNKKLQQENEKYTIKLEQFSKQKQKTHEIYKKNTLNLENTIKQLQYECDQLHAEVNALNAWKMEYNKQNDSLIYDMDEKQYELVLSDTIPSDTKGFRLSLTGADISKELHSEFGYTENAETEIITNIDNDVVTQLIQFGYNENDIHVAMNQIYDKNNVNNIIETIENNKHVKFMKNVYSKIDDIVDTSKIHINKLQNKIKLLKKENNRLIIIINNTGNN